MADEKENVKGDEAADSDKDAGKKEKKKGGKRINKLLIIAPLMAIALGAGGYFGYSYLWAGKGKGGHAGASGDGKVKSVLYSMEPFVVNLSEPGRYLKVTMQFETDGEASQPLIAEKAPILRDVIITLISSQTYEIASSAEGKLQLKDEILLRTNRVFGKEVFRNLYFTDFVMQ
jgi:flagellar FliL protein